MSDKIDVLAVMGADIDSREATLRYLESLEGEASRPVCERVSRERIEVTKKARAAIAELIEATPALLALYRTKWGNLDPDANSALATFERAFSRVGGA